MGVNNSHRQLRPSANDGMGTCAPRPLAGLLWSAGWVEWEGIQLPSPKKLPTVAAMLPKDTVLGCAACLPFAGCAAA